MMIAAKFFDRDALTVAQQLLGKVLKVKHQQTWLAAMIIETEAYYLHDKASHASLGYTPKREALFMPAGTIYMYYARGADSLNISCHGEGNAVLCKAGVPYIDENTSPEMIHIMQQLNPVKTINNVHQNIRPVAHLCSGQTLLCRALGLRVTDWDKRQFDRQRLYFDDVGYQPQQIIQTTRLGIPPGRDEHLLYRCIDRAYIQSCSSNPLSKRKWLKDKHY